MTAASTWIIVGLTAISLLVAILSLIRSYKADDESALDDIREEISIGLAGHTALLSGHSAQLSELSREQSRMRQELSDHKEYDLKMHEDITRMFAAIQAELKQIPHTPKHEEDIPATRREMRHMRDNIESVNKLMLERFGQFEESLRKDLAAMVGMLAQRVDQIETRIKSLEGRRE